MGFLLLFIFVRLSVLIEDGTECAFDLYVGWVMFWFSFEGKLARATGHGCADGGLANAAASGATEMGNGAWNCGTLHSPVPLVCDILWHEGCGALKSVDLYLLLGLFTVLASSH